MSTYVLLVSFTDKGRRNFKQEYTESRESNLIHNALRLDKTRREAVQLTSNRQGIPLDSVR